MAPRAADDAASKASRRKKVEDLGEKTGADAAGPLRLTGALDTYAAAELREQLAGALKDRPALTVELSGVESCDFSTIQLLCSARRSAEQAGKPFNVTGLSEAVRGVSEALGVSPDAFSGPRSE